MSILVITTTTGQLTDDWCSVLVEKMDLSPWCVQTLLCTTVKMQPHGALCAWGHVLLAPSQLRLDEGMGGDVGVRDEGGGLVSTSRCRPSLLRNDSSFNFSVSPFFPDMCSENFATRQCAVKRRLQPLEVPVTCAIRSQHPFAFKWNFKETARYLHRPQKSFLSCISTQTTRLFFLPFSLLFPSPRVREHRW